jgi:hypothetical protein
MCSKKTRPVQRQPFLLVDCGGIKQKQRFSGRLFFYIHYQSAVYRKIKTNFDDYSQRLLM